MLELIVFSVPIGLILSVVITPFVIRTQKCPRCGHKLSFVIYHAGKTCRACRTRLIIRDRKIELIP